MSRCTIGTPGQAILQDFSWTVLPGEAWVITGPNGGGKSALAAALAGRLPAGPAAGELSPPVLPDPARVALVSFELQSALIFAERHNDDSDFVEGGIDSGTSARDFILGGRARRPGQALPAGFEALCAGLGLTDLLGRGLKFLSTGELRKALLCRDLLREPAILVADELFEGLDQAARAFVSGHLESLIREGRCTVILVSDRYENLPAGLDRVLHLAGGRGVFAGSRAEYGVWLARNPGQTGAEPDGASLAGLGGTAISAETGLTGGPEAVRQPEGRAEVLVDLRRVTVAWSGRRVIDALDFRLESGSHTLVRGPNGCGKTTLLNLITGDNPQVYANEVSVFGMRRGSGESVWDIKRRIGMVSYQLHLEYLYHCESSVADVIVSGFHDSIGLYEATGELEQRAAADWLSVLGLAGRADWPFTRLSYGEQRAVLIARAVVKRPPLLILDEPCHGLDVAHRRQALALAEWIGSHTATTILMVTHDPAEYLPCLRRVLEYAGGGRWRLDELASGSRSQRGAPAEAGAMSRGAGRRAAGGAAYREG